LDVETFHDELAALPSEAAREVLLETIKCARLVACGEPPYAANQTLWSLSVPDSVAALGFAVRETCQDPERVFSPEEAALVRAAIEALTHPN
jgi:hypothetical protein